MIAKNSCYNEYPASIVQWDKTLGKCPCGYDIEIYYSFEYKNPMLSVKCLGGYQHVAQASIFLKTDIANIRVEKDLLLQFKDLYNYFIDQETSRLQYKS